MLANYLHVLTHGSFDGDPDLFHFCQVFQKWVGLLVVDCEPMLDEVTIHQEGVDVILMGLHLRDHEVNQSYRRFLTVHAKISMTIQLEQITTVTEDTFQLQIEQLHQYILIK